MQRTRNNNRGAAYDQWVIDRAAEVAEEQRLQQEAEAQAEAAEAARIEADPILSYQKSTNELYAGEQNIVLHGVVDERYLAQFGTVKRGRCSEEQKTAARIEFRRVATDYIRNEANGAILCAMVDRNGLHPGEVASYLLCHKVLLLWAGYPDAVVEESPIVEVAPVMEVAEPVLTPSERAAKKYQDDRTIIVVTDPATGQQFTEFDLSRLNAVDERRLRRIAEKGNSFGSAFEGYLDVKDAQHARDQEIARRAAEEAQQ
jgi:hypothetical protein